MNSCRNPAGRSRERPSLSKLEDVAQQPQPVRPEHLELPALPPRLRLEPALDPPGPWPVSVLHAAFHVHHAFSAADGVNPPVQQIQFLQQQSLPHQPLRLARALRPLRPRRCRRFPLPAAPRRAGTPLPFAEPQSSAAAARTQSMPAATAQAGSLPPRRSSCDASICLSSIYA